MLSLAAPVPAQKKPEKIKLTAQSKDGAVLIRVPVQPFPYALQFSKDGNSGFMSRVYMMAIEEGAHGYRYIARTLSPGRYRLDSIWQQGHWSACLEKGTFEIVVSPGKIAFLGTLRTERVLGAIQQQAIKSGEAMMSGTNFAVSRDLAELPIIDGRDESDVVAAREFAAAKMNGSDQLVELARVNDAQFSTSGVGKAIKICG